MSEEQKKPQGKFIQSCNNKTPFVNEQTADRKWYLIDAKNQNLGRLCCEIVRILRGTRKPSFTPHCDNGDFVVVINAKHICFTGKNKGTQTKYYRHSGYTGGLRYRTLDETLEGPNPERAIIYTVSKMLPKGTDIRSKLEKKLKVYAEAEHPHAAQSPILLTELPVL